jgi:hypothetical protein
MLRGANKATLRYERGLITSAFISLLQCYVRSCAGFRTPATTI